MGKGAVWNLARYELSRRRERLEGGPLIVTPESEEALKNGNETVGRYYVELDRAENHVSGEGIY